MPTPIGHSIGGYVAGRLAHQEARLSTGAMILVAAVLANLPDADFIPGLLIGEPAAYHRGVSHTVAAALVVALVVAAAGTRFRLDFRRMFTLAFAVYGSHLVLDALMPDTRGSAGVQLFWPLSDRYVGYALPVPWRFRYVLDLRLADDTIGFFGVLLQPRTFLVFAVEAVLFLPLLAIPALVTRWRRRGDGVVRERSRDRGTRGRPSRSNSGKRRSGDRRDA